MFQAFVPGQVIFEAGVASKAARQTWQPEETLADNLRQNGKLRSADEPCPRNLLFARYSRTKPTAFLDQFFLPRIVIVRVAMPVPPALVAPIVTLDVAAVLGVPLMRPVDELSTSPGGSPVAL